MYYICIYFLLYMKLDKCNTMEDIFRKIFLNIIRRMSTVHDVFILFHCKKK